MAGAAAGPDLVGERGVGAGSGGVPVAEIGAEVYLSVATVKTYVSRVLTKLELTNCVQVALLVHDARLTGERRHPPAPPPGGDLGAGAIFDSRTARPLFPLRPVAGPSL